MKITINGKPYEVYLSDISLNVYYLVYRHKINPGLLGVFELVDENGKSEILEEETWSRNEPSQGILPLNTIYNVLQKLMKTHKDLEMSCEFASMCEFASIAGSSARTTSCFLFTGSLHNEVQRKYHLCVPPLMDYFNVREAMNKSIFVEKKLRWTTLTEKEAIQLYQFLSQHECIKPGWTLSDFVSKVLWLNLLSINMFLKKEPAPVLVRTSKEGLFGDKTLREIKDIDVNQLITDIATLTTGLLDKSHKKELKTDLTPAHFSDLVNVLVKVQSGKEKEISPAEAQTVLSFNQKLKASGGDAKILEKLDAIACHLPKECPPGGPALR
ncbi:MAG: hypothetical protein ACYCQI_02325 [Gammaproteobacteria bacterium]